MKSELTAKQTAFIDLYADPGSDTYNNAYQSALQAGYSPKTARAASKDILSNPRVRTAIELRRADLYERFEVTVEFVVAGILTGLRMAKEKEHLTAMARFLEMLCKFKGMFSDNSDNAMRAPEINVYLPDGTKYQPQQILGLHKE